MRPSWGSNSQSWDMQTDMLSTALWNQALGNCDEYPQLLHMLYVVHSDNNKKKKQYVLMKKASYLELSRYSA